MSDRQTVFTPESETPETKHFRQTQKISHRKFSFQIAKREIPEIKYIRWTENFHSRMLELAKKNRKVSASE